ncbi:MAG TPA: hypothetical protein VG848_13095 [Acetobacteraceae bacterium]|jgi:hypothetical protein|nr:hypothetical protein [Acetobacteraceae bacterium]
MRRTDPVTIGAYVLAALVALVGLRARADETLRTLIVSGDWIAKEEQVPGSPAADVCIAFTAGQDNGFGLRAGAGDYEIRYSQDNWVLPDNVKGNLAFDIGPYHSVLAVTSNTRDTAIVSVSREQLDDMISAMETVSVMRVTAGIASPQEVSLHGSNRATTAFLRCVAGIDVLGGANTANLRQ